MVKDDRKYLLHIIECISRIEDDVRDGRAASDATHMIQDAVIRNLQVMTESTQRLSLELRPSRSEIRWTGIAGFRNLLVRDYFGVDLGIVWEIVVKDVPALKTVILQAVG